MTEREQGNRAIAIFDGFQIGILSGWLTGKNECAYKKNENGEIIIEYKPGSLKYHTSWDWLMPVVEKINKLFEPFTEALFITVAGNHLRNIHNALANVDIKTAWQRIIEAISWFNSRQNEKV